MLENIIKSAPAAMILCNLDGQITYSNPHANELLNSGQGQPWLSRNAWL